MAEATVFIIVLHFTLMGYGGDVIPEGQHFRAAFASEDQCRKEIPKVRRSFEARGLPISADWIKCERLEIKQ